jgi:hypothetical protein
LVSHHRNIGPHKARRTTGTSSRAKRGAPPKQGDDAAMTVHDHSTRANEAGWAPPAANGAPPTWTPPPTDPTDPTQPGQPVKPPGKHRAKIAVAGAIVAAAVISGGVTAAVVSSGSSSSSSTQAGAGGTRGGFGGGQGGFGGAAGGGTATSLHGTSVVSDGNGGYTTELTQTGTVSAVSSSSITVKSEDGYSKTYVVGSSTSVDNGADKIGDVAKGNTVRVVATSADDKATVTTITDTTIATTTQQGGTVTLPGGAAPGGTTQQGGTAATGT